MTGWNRSVSEARILRLSLSVPQTSVSVRQFNLEELERRRRSISLAKVSQPGLSEDLIFNVRPSEAVVVDGVHIYARLIDYAQAMAKLENETEVGHRRLLQMLHVHYAACDSVAEEFEAQRVDYHGSRMHAVIVTPVESERARLVRAIEFADALTRTIAEISGRVGQGQYQTRVRIGIDTGRAVAVNSGRGSEPEPLFLGQPANYAAKLADGDEPGTFLSANAKNVLGLGWTLGGLVHDRASPVSPEEVQARFPRERFRADASLIERASSEVVRRFPTVASVPSFDFHQHEPPLRSIKFDDLMPSNTIRMELLSLFADLDGFTAYVDECVSTGRVSEMVANLHVIRGELAGTLKEDFGGRKVRFIGDCLHGVVAQGDRYTVDRSESVRLAVASVAGIRSSFELCQLLLPGLSQLGIAIGLEFGTTPISRIGLRGDRSVRTCASKAVSASEHLQNQGTGQDTMIGERARQFAPAVVARIFDDKGRARGLDYESYLAHVTSPARVASGNVEREVRPYSR